MEVAYEDLTCGVEERGINLDQFEPGTTLTFERGEATGTPLSSQESSGWPAMTPVVATRVVTPCPPGTDEAAATVAAQRATWEATAIDSYDFALRYTTDFLFGTYQISVVDGTPVSANVSNPVRSPTTSTCLNSPRPLSRSSSSSSGR